MADPRNPACFLKWPLEAHLVSQSVHRIPFPIRDAYDQDHLVIPPDPQMGKMGNVPKPLADKQGHPVFSWHREHFVIVSLKEHFDRNCWNRAKSGHTRINDDPCATPSKSTHNGFLHSEKKKTNSLTNDFLVLLLFNSAFLFYVYLYEIKNVPSRANPSRKKAGSRGSCFAKPSTYDSMQQRTCCKAQKTTVKPV